MTRTWRPVVVDADTARSTSVASAPVAPVIIATPASSVVRRTRVVICMQCKRTRQIPYLCTCRIGTHTGTILQWVSMHLKHIGDFFPFVVVQKNNVWISCHKSLKCHWRYWCVGLFLRGTPDAGENRENLTMFNTWKIVNETKWKTCRGSPLQSFAHKNASTLTQHTMPGEKESHLDLCRNLIMTLFWPRARNHDYLCCVAVRTPCCLCSSPVAVALLPPQQPTNLRSVGAASGLHLQKRPQHSYNQQALAKRSFPKVLQAWSALFFSSKCQTTNCLPLQSLRRFFRPVDPACIRLVMRTAAYSIMPMKRDKETLQESTHVRVVWKVHLSWGDRPQVVSEWLKLVFSFFLKYRRVR